jgi:mitotic spindle assembly checkpoint protein MAD2B
MRARNAAVQQDVTDTSQCTVSQVSLVIYSKVSIPMERYVFSTEAFPIISPSEINSPFDFGSTILDVEGNSTNVRPTAMIDLTSQFRGLLTRMSTEAAKLSSLPADCTFTIAIELRDDTKPRSDPPIGHPQPWIPAAPGLQRAEKRADEDRLANDVRPKMGKYIGTGLTRPVRNVDAGPVIMEVWIEEGKDKEIVAKAPKITPRVEVSYDDDSAPGQSRERNPGSVTTTSQNASGGSRGMQEQHQ